ncbi:MAG: alpha/beta fold hydrolase [Thermocrispum sp.]
MNTAPTVPAITATLDGPDGTLHYELRGTGPLLMLAAAPMDAAVFEPVADLLAADFTVLTSDPRGINRSKLHDPQQESTPQLRADDLSRLLAHVDAGPAAVLGTSGGACSVLALAQAHPEQLHTVLAHEPAFYALLDDREQHRAVVEDMIARYAADDVAGAWQRFLSNANIQVTDEVLAMIVPAEPEPQAAADNRYGFLRMLRATTSWEPDLDVLRSGPRVVVGVGADSGGELCERISHTIATALGSYAVVFPGGHLGFLDDPRGFAATLRGVLS